MPLQKLWVPHKALTKNILDILHEHLYKTLRSTAYRGYDETKILPLVVIPTAIIIVSRLKSNK